MGISVPFLFDLCENLVAFEVKMVFLDNLLDFLQGFPALV